MSSNNPTLEINYAEDFEKKDLRYLEGLPASQRKKIPFIILKNTAYQLILDKYLHLLELCKWKHNDDEGNNKRLAEVLRCPGLKVNNLDAVAHYIVELPIDCPTEDVAKEFYKKVTMGELEFACRMHIINGYTAIDLASAFFYHYDEKRELSFNPRYEVNDIIFLDD